MQLTHLGQSCLLIEAAGARVLVDPGALSPGFAELRELDAVVVTHGHIDHLDPQRLPALLAANPRARVVAEPSVAADLAGRGDVEADVTALHPGETTSVGGLTLRGVGGLHAVIHEDIPRIGNVGVVFSADGEPTFLHPGDSYEVGPDLGPVDVLGLPLAAPWCALKETVAFARAVAAPVVVPIHDVQLAPVGRNLFLATVGNLLGEASQVRDLAGQPATTFPSAEPQV